MPCSSPLSYLCPCHSTSMAFLYKFFFKIQNVSFTKMHLKILSVKWCPFCPGGGWVVKLATISHGNVFSFPRPCVSPPLMCAATIPRQLIMSPVWQADCKWALWEQQFSCWQPYQTTLVSIGPGGDKLGKGRERCLGINLLIVYKHFLYENICFQKIFYGKEYWPKRCLGINWLSL